MSKELNIPIPTILEAIKDSGAIISTIADRLGVNWHTAKKYIELHEETKEAYLDEEEIILDKAEGTIHNSIIVDGDVQSSKWILSTKGKKRGYSEKHDINIGGELKVVYLDKQDENL